MGDPRRTYFNTGDTTRLVRGVPQVTGLAQGMGPCPHCGCRTLYDVVVTIESPLLVTGKGAGFYVGCPACPFASPMLMVASHDVASSS